MGSGRQGVSNKRTTLPRRSRPQWLRKLDQRSTLGRALNIRLAELTEHLGGLSEVSSVERSVMERFLHVEAMAVQIEEAVRDGAEFDLQQYLALVDRHLRLSLTLGMRRRARRVPSLAELVEASPE